MASALCAPFHRHASPARVLEIGAGTGAVTRYLGSILGDDDELDICEIQPDFVEILRRDVLTRSYFEPAVTSGRVRLLRTPVQSIAREGCYDFIISGLPFTAFELADVRTSFEVIRRSLKPGGVFSYFEYMGFRRIWRCMSLGRRRTRVRSVSAYLSQTIHEHQVAERVIVRNFPPALARYLQFAPRPARQPCRVQVQPAFPPVEDGRPAGVSYSRSAETRSS